MPMPNGLPNSKTKPTSESTQHELNNPIKKFLTACLIHIVISIGNMDSQFGNSQSFSLFWDQGSQQWCYGDSDNYLNRIDFTINDKEAVDLNCDFQLSSITISPDCKHAAFGGENGVTVRLFSNISESGVNLCRTTLPVRDSKFSSDSRHL